MEAILIIIIAIFAIKILLPLACIPAAFAFMLLGKLWEHKWLVLIIILIAMGVGVLLDKAGIKL